MKLEEVRNDQSVTIKIEGRLDTGSYQELEKMLTAVLDRGEKNLVLDCTRLEYISSSGLRVFLFGLKRTGQAGGKMVLCGLNSNISEIFVIAGFSSYFTITGTPEEAQACFLP